MKWPFSPPTPEAAFPGIHPSPWHPNFEREAVIAALAMAVGVLCVYVFGFERELPPLLEAPPAEPREPAAAAAASQRSSSSRRTQSDIAPSQLQQLLEARRSIQPKDYTGAPVAEDKVRAILEAAPWAPNHGKTEPWRYVVFGGAAGKQRLLDMTLRWYEARPADFWRREFILAKTSKPEFADGAAFAAYFVGAAASKWGKASHLVALCARRQRPESGKKQHPEWEEDAAVACTVQNMHLLATALGVGAYWSSWYAHYRGSAEMARDLGLEPESGDRCLGVFVLGDVAPETMSSNRAVRLPLSEVARWVSG